MNPKSKKVILFANGDLPAPDRVLSHISDDDFLIAVDGGLNHMIPLGLTPNLIIGDLDSADQKHIDRFRAEGVQIQKYPEDKDQTDLEIALEAAQAMNPAVILVMAALGNRLDQTLANVFLLTQTKLSGTNIRLVDGNQEVFLIRVEGEIHGRPGERVSLLPLCEPAKGIHTEGLKFSLDGETLYPDQTRGISNQMTANFSKITLSKGLLLCIHEYYQPS